MGDTLTYLDHDNLLSVDITPFENQTVLRVRILTVSYEEQIMSADKYPSIFQWRLLCLLSFKYLL